jgi:hypothetical protein
MTKHLFPMIGLVMSLCTAPTVASANIILNPNFFPANGGAGYGAVPNWTQSPFPSTLGGFPYLSGSNTSAGPFWNQGTVPGGISTVGFIQVYPGSATNSLRQTMSLAAGTTYSLSYLENARTGPSPLMTVLVGSQTVVAQHTDSAVGAGNPFRLVTASFTATAASADLIFSVAQQSSGNDATALITDVQVNAVPEPVSLALLGFGAAGLYMIRRRPA